MVYIHQNPTSKTHSFTMQKHGMIGGNFYPTLLYSAIAKTVTTLCVSTGPFHNSDKQHYMCYRWDKWIV